MSAFDKWWDKNHTKYYHSEQKATKNAWDATLVWIYYKMKVGGDPWAIFQIIFEELNEMKDIK